MSIDGYYVSKLSAAVGCLVGLGDIRSRVEHAFVAMITVRPEEFSNKEIGKSFQALFDRCTSHEAEHEDEGTFRATLRHMSDNDVESVAHEIFDIYTRLIIDLAPDLMM